MLKKNIAVLNNLYVRRGQFVVAVMDTLLSLFSIDIKREEKQAIRANQFLYQIAKGNFS